MRKPTATGKGFVQFGDVTIGTEPTDKKEPFSICSVFTLRGIKKLQRDIAAAIEWREREAE